MRDDQVYIDVLTLGREGVGEMGTPAFHVTRIVHRHPHQLDMMCPSRVLAGRPGFATLNHQRDHHAEQGDGGNDGRHSAIGLANTAQPVPVDLTVTVERAQRQRRRHDQAHGDEHEQQYRHKKHGSAR